MKTAAMQALFHDRPQHLPAIIRYHLDHASVPRRDKFHYYFDTLFREPLSSTQLDGLCARFSELIREGMRQAAFVPGALEFLRANGPRLPCFVVSASPQDEVDSTLAEHGLTTYIRSAHGSPTCKREHLRRLLDEHGLRAAACIFVGDGRADWEAASSHGIPFVHRLTPHAPEPFAAGMRAISDMHELSDLWLRRARLANAKESPGVLSSTLPPGSTWVYLGRDFLSLRRWHKGLGPGHPRLDIAKALHDQGHRLRQPFLNYLAGLGRKHNSLEWWSSRIAEENTLAGSLFQDICDLFTAHELLDGAAAPSLIVAENPALIESLRAEGQGVLTDEWQGAKAACMAQALFVIRWCLFWIRSLGRWGSARALRRGPLLPQRQPGHPLALMHTCMGPGYFAAAGPRDAYYGPLPDELRRRGYTVATLPWLYNPDLSWINALRYMRARPGEFIIPEDFYQPNDYLWAARMVWRQGRMPTLPQIFENTDISILIRAARRDQMANSSAAEFILHERLFPRLIKAGFRPDVYIDLWENSLAEKPAILAIRNHSPKTVIIGYQHLCSLPHLFLGLFTSNDPADGAPLPDIIACNSKFTRDTLLKSGFPPARLQVGASLRFPHLIAQGSDSDREPGAVLVALSLDPSATSEALAMLSAAFPGRESGLKFWIKPHPMMPRHVWQSLLRASPTPEHMQTVSGSMSVWLSRAACAITIASTSALELALAGIPVIQIGRSTSLDFNPLADFPQWRKPCQDPIQLREEVIRFTRLSGPERTSLKAWTEWARQECLSPLNDDTVKSFLPSASRDHEACAA